MSHNAGEQGAQGAKGEPGTNGEDGDNGVDVSTVTVSQLVVDILITNNTHFRKNKKFANNFSRSK